MTSEPFGQESSSIRIVAVDWSGARDARTQRNTIWIADLRGARCELSCGRTREQVCAWLIEQKSITPRMLVGLDFAFSYPAWFVREHAADVLSFWQAIASGRAEEWINDCRAPFWGRAGNPRPPQPAWILEKGLRNTDQEVRVNGNHPKSVFQIYFPGAVGTGTLRGIPCLLALRDVGFFIWPFDPAGDATVVEIYPRLYTGETRTSVPESRIEHLEGQEYVSLSPEVRTAAAHSPDAFDALAAVLGMRRDLPFWGQTDPATELEKLEGKIWNPQRRFAVALDR